MERKSVVSNWHEEYWHWMECRRRDMLGTSGASWGAVPQEVLLGMINLMTNVSVGHLSISPRYTSLRF